LAGSWIANRTLRGQVAWNLLSVHFSSQISLPELSFPYRGSGNGAGASRVNWPEKKPCVLWIEPRAAKPRRGALQTPRLPPNLETQTRLVAPCGALPRKCLSIYSFIYLFIYVRVSGARGDQERQDSAFLGNTYLLRRTLQLLGCLKQGNRK
jgi:hypothetical protein